MTEDHRFWSVTDDAWVELQDLDTSDVLLTPDGATVTVDFLDWDAGVTTDAYDLTVDQEHNFFVTADTTGEPVLVHNANEGAFCSIPVDGDLATALADIVLTPGQADAIRSRALPGLTSDERVSLARGIASSPDRQLAAVRAAGFPLVAQRAAQTGQVTEVLSASNFEDAVRRIDDLFESLVDSGFSGTPVGFASDEAWDDAAALIRQTFGDPDLVVGVRGSAVTGLSFNRGTVGSGIGDIDIFVVSDELFAQGLRAGGRGRDGALRVQDTRRVPAWEALQNEVASRFVDRNAFPGGLETSIRIFSDAGFAQVQTGWEVLN